MTYPEIMNKLRISKKRIERLHTSVEGERGNQQSLLLQLGHDISEATGEVVKIGIGGSKSSNYDKKSITTRIVELRNRQNMSFTSIASTLNNEGYKPRTATTFSQATVYQMYKAASRRIENVGSASIQ